MCGNTKTHNHIVYVSIYKKRVNVNKMQGMIVIDKHFKIFGSPQGAYNTQNNSYCILIVLYNVIM